jgi:hypothetical protein
MVILTVRLVDRVKSRLLGIELVKILSKLVKAMKGKFDRRVSDFSFVRAKEISKQAVKWGCKVAIGWAYEMNFLRYLAMMSLNDQNLFGKCIT